MIRFAFASARTRPASILVIALLGLLSAAILTVSGTVLATAIALPAPPQQFDAPVVVAGPAGFPLPDQEHQTVAYPEGSLVPASTERAVTGMDAVADVTHYREPRTHRLVALGVSPRAGTSTRELAAQLDADLDSSRVLTGDQRGRAENPDIPAQRVPLVVAGAASGGVLVLVVVIVVWAALHLITDARRTELRLWRLIGATPRQLRGLLRAEATIVATAGALAGAVTGPFLADWLLRTLTRSGALPSLLRPTGEWVAAAVAWLVTVLAVWLTSSLLSGPAVRRATAAPQPTSSHVIAPVRRPLALVVAGGAIMLLAAAPFFGGEDGASSLAGPATLVAVVAVAIAAPHLIHNSLPLLDRRGPAQGVRGLARRDMTTRPARLGSLLSLLTLGVTLALTNGYTATTMSAAAHPDTVTANAVVRADGADPGDTLRAVAGAVGNHASTSRVVTSSGWIERPYDHKGSDPLPVLGIDNAADLTSHDATRGALSDVTGKRIAITADDATNQDLDVGDRITYRFGDGAGRQLTVAAVLSSHGTQQRIVPSRLLARHVRTPESTVAVRAPSVPDTQLRSALHNAVAGVGTTAEVTNDPELALRDDSDDVGGMIYLSVATMALLFTAVITFYSITALMLSRREEFTTWWLVGATRSQLVRLGLTEVLHVACMALGIGTVIAAASVLAVGAALGHWPAGSPILLVIVTVATIGVTVIAAVTLTLRATKPAKHTHGRE